ncbi:MAG: hypothetical protein IT336_01125 [Thermomicrobiales bacterium]|nr:hypothetical protein [Thermomicrobiales bacterium]
MPNRPWTSTIRRTSEYAAYARAGELISVGIAMVALFLFGRSLGAGGDLPVATLAIGLVGSAVAYLLPWFIARLPVRTQPPTHRRPGRYSEESLLRGWPTRRVNRDAAMLTPIDRSDDEG